MKTGVTLHKRGNYVSLTGITQNAPTCACHVTYDMSSHMKRKRNETPTLGLIGRNEPSGAMTVF